MPREIRIAKKRIPLNYPEEAGISADFIECLIYNVYGLGIQLGDARTILDIGANVGFFSLAARSYYPCATIHAYEPNPRVQHILHSNIKEIDVKSYSEAVGAYAGRVRVIDESISNMAHTSHCQNGEGDIGQIHLDTAIKRLGGCVDLLKMDCEGAEWEMFELKDCWGSIKNIRMEYHLFGGKTENDVLSALADLGFRIIHLEPSRRNMGIVWGQHN